MIDVPTSLATLGKRLRALREIRGMSRDELAAATATPDLPAFLAAFGKRLRALREERGMSRDELAAAAETTLPRLEAIEEGRHDPRYFLLLRLAQALDTTLGPLTGGITRHPRLVVLGRVIRQLREEQGVSREDLATAAETTVPELDAIEDGSRDPPVDLLRGLADGLGMKPSGIMRRVEAEES